MHWIFFALIAAALIMLLLLGRLKAKIDSAGRREYAVRIYFCGIRLLVLRVIPEFEGYIRPKLIIYCGNRKKEVYPLEGKSKFRLNGKCIKALYLRARIGAEDAAFSALISGAINLLGGAIALLCGRKDWLICAAPVFGENAFWLEAHCIISACIADIIFALLGKNKSKGRKQ